jgi:riboflavin synthase
MFTGIIENTGTVEAVEDQGSNKIFRIKSALAPFLKVDQSLSHNGVCLTVEKIAHDSYQVTAIEETLQKTNLSSWTTGAVVNLERCLLLNGRIDGHIVQGHVDTTARCTGIIDKKGSWEYTFELDKAFASLVIEKGSIALNGISLTLFNVTENTFTAGIIPYTFNHTNIGQLQPGDTVNIEFDMIGKYVSRIASLKKQSYL